MIRIFIGYDYAEAAAYHTLCHSIIERSSVPVSITPIAKRHFKHIHDRPTDPNQSNEFAFTRWLVPYLCGYKGWAIFMDCDMLVLDDINNLWKIRDENYAVQVVKHDHQPKNKIKYLGTKQTLYRYKNWSSVMLMNTAKCKQLTPEVINEMHGLDLHQFKWLDGLHQIGDLPLEWNYLVDYYHNRSADTLSLLHYTEGGPYFRDYTDCDFADLWWREWHAMNHCNNASFDTHRDIRIRSDRDGDD